MAIRMRAVIGAVLALLAWPSGVALAGPQEPETQKRVYEIRIPDMELEGYEITIPGFSFTMPAFDVYLPEMAFSDFEHELDVAIPAFAIHVPELEFEVPVGLGADWHGWDHDGPGLQDVETDTTFDVAADGRLEVRNHAGEIIVRTWDRDAVRVQASHSSRDRVKIFTSESAVKIKSESRHGPPDMVDYTLTVPRSMALDLWGFYTDVRVEGVQNGVRVETLDGTVTLTNTTGDLSVRSVEGDVVVEGARGRLEVNNVENEIRITDFEGTLFAESIDGDIWMERVRSADVEAKTVDGDVYYDGSIDGDGRYRFTSHDGDVTVAMPENANVTVSVATFDGEFVTGFPIELNRAEATRRFSFTLGDGSARLELHSFDGDIELVRR